MDQINYTVCRSGGKWKNDFTKILFITSEFEVFWFDSDAVSVLGFHFQVSIFAFQLQIKVDFYLYVKHKIIDYFISHFFANNVLFLRHDASKKKFTSNKLSFVS